MLFKALTIAATMSLVVQASDQVHGQGAKGTTMGPVAFLWPAVSSYPIMNHAIQYFLTHNRIAPGVPTMTTSPLVVVMPLSAIELSFLWEVSSHAFDLHRSAKYQSCWRRCFLHCR